MKLFFSTFSSLFLNLFKNLFKKKLRVKGNKIRKPKISVANPGIISRSAAIAFAALLLIIPGFATDIIGFLLIFPISRRFIFNKFFIKTKKKSNKNNFIDGEFEDIENDDDRKI